MPRKKPLEELAYVQEMSARYNTPFGAVEYIKICRYDEKPMSWRQVWDTFAAAYPGSWAIEVYPPDAHLVDDANVYHLFILPEGLAGTGLNLDRRR